jgi:integrase
MSNRLTAILNDLLSKKRAVALRKEMAKEPGERRDAAAVVNEVMEDWLFTTRQGTQLDPSNLRKVFYRLLVAAKLRRVRFHDLRHTFATLLIQQGEGLPYIRDQLGHSSIKITVDTYGHLVPGGNRQAVDKLDERVVVNGEKEAAATLE